MSNNSRSSTGDLPARAGGENNNQPSQNNLKPVQVKLVLLGKFFYHRAAILKVF